MGQVLESEWARVSHLIFRNKVEMKNFAYDGNEDWGNLPSSRSLPSFCRLTAAR